MNYLKLPLMLMISGLAVSAWCAEHKSLSTALVIECPKAVQNDKDSLKLERTANRKSATLTYRQQKYPLHQVGGGRVYESAETPPEFTIHIGAFDKIGDHDNVLLQTDEGDFSGVDHNEVFRGCVAR